MCGAVDFLRAARSDLAERGVVAREQVIEDLAAAMIGLARNKVRDWAFGEARQVPFRRFQIARQSVANNDGSHELDLFRNQLFAARASAARAFTIACRLFFLNDAVGSISCTSTEMPMGVDS